MDISKIQCIIQTYNQPATKELQTWLKHMKVDWRYGQSGYELDVAKNRNVDIFLKHDVPNGKEYLLMIANDMVPLKSTQKILTEEGPLLYCQSMGNEGRLDHYGDRNVSAACFRAHKNVFLSFGPPWFRMGHSADRMTQTYCDCSYFKDRCQENEFDGREVGKIGHEQRIILMPHEEEPYKKWAVIWPSQWNERDICNNNPITPPPSHNLNIDPSKQATEVITENITISPESFKV